MAEISRGDPDQLGDFGNQSLGNDRSQSPAMRFFLAKLIDDQQIDAFKHRTLWLLGDLITIAGAEKTAGTSFGVRRHNPSRGARCLLCSGDVHKTVY